MKFERQDKGRIEGLFNFLVVEDKKKLNERYHSHFGVSTLTHLPDFQSWEVKLPVRELLRFNQCI